MAINEMISNTVQDLGKPIDVFPTSPAISQPSTVEAPMAQPQMSPNQVFQKITDLDKQGKAVQDQINNEMAKGDVDKLTRQKLAEIEISKRDLFKQAFPTLEAPQPPEIKNTQRDLGVIGDLMTGLIAGMGMLHGKAGATAFVNTYNGMVDSFRRYDAEDFSKKQVLFKDQLEVARMRNEQKLGAYQDVINKIIRGEELDEKAFKLKAELAMRPLTMYMDERTRLEKLEENWAKIYETMTKNEEMTKYHMGMLGKGAGGTLYKDFASGYKEDLKNKHPDWTQGKIDLETANEARRRGIEEKVKVSIDRLERTQKVWSEKAKTVGDKVMSGKIPPDVAVGMGGAPFKIELTNYLAEKDFDLKQATLDWKAEIKYIQTLNGPQQTRIRQNIAFAYTTLDKIEELNKKWERSEFPPLNKAILGTAKSGALGKEARDIATQLETQIADLTGDLGQIYMGGNSPTDHSLELAAKNLNGEWAEGQLEGNIELVRYNLGLRTQSLKVGASGLSTEKKITPPETNKGVIQGDGWKATPVN
jgi:hypothetical protein